MSTLDEDSPDSVCAHALKEGKWRALGALKLEHPTWLLPNLLPRKSMILLYGKRGEGKTFLALDWALSLATGNDWGDLAKIAKKNPTPERIAYMLTERPEGLMRRTLGWLVHRGHDPDSPEYRLLMQTGSESVVFVAQKRFSLDDSEQLRQLSEKVEEVKPTLLILDPLVDFMDGSENDARDMQKFAYGLRALVDERNCSVLLVHHEGKTEGRGARGSSALEAAMDTVISLKSTGRETADLVVTKQREAEGIEPIGLRFASIFDEADRPLGKFPDLAERVFPKKKQIAEGQATSKKSKNLSMDEKKAIVLEIMNRLVTWPGHITISHIQKEFLDKTGKGASTCRSAVVRLIEEKQVIHGPKESSSNAETYLLPGVSSHIEGEPEAAYSPSVAEPIDVKPIADHISQPS